MSKIDADDSREEGELSDDGEVIDVDALPTDNNGPVSVGHGHGSCISVVSVVKSSAPANQNNQNTDSAKSASSSRSRGGKKSKGHPGNMALIRLMPNAKVEAQKRAAVRHTQSPRAGKGKTKSLAAALRSKAEASSRTRSSINNSSKTSKKPVPLLSIPLPPFAVAAESSRSQVPSPPSGLPPPNRPLPQPLPLQLPKRKSLLSKKLQRRTPLKKVAESMQDQIRAKSPLADVNDTDYIDLLLEYRQIQNQLESIRKEETAQLILSNSVDSGDGATTSAGPSAVSLTLDNADWQIVDEVGSDQEGEPPEGDQAAQPSTSTQQQVEPGGSDVDDDDELQLLQLRAAALASAAQANKKFIEQGRTSSRSSWSSPSTPSRPQSGRSRQASGGSTSRKRSQPRRDSREPPVAEKRRREDTSRSRRDKERPARGGSGARLQPSRQDRDQQLRLQRILALDDHAEQTRRFLEIMGVKVDDVLQRGSRAPSPGAGGVAVTDELTSVPLEDNYDEVEMEVSSIDSAPEVEDIPHTLTETVPTMSNWLQYMQYMQQMQLPDDIMASFFQQQFMSWAQLPYGSLTAPVFPIPAPPPPLPDTDPVVPPEPESELEEEVANPDFSSQDGDIDTAPSPSSSDSDEELEDEEDLLRAQLLQSVVRRRKARLDAEARSTDSPSPPPVPSASSDDQRRPTEPQVAPRHKAQYRQRPSVPQNAPVVISLGEDSSDEEASPEGKKSAGGLLNSLDLFLKEARQTVEAREKKGKERHPAKTMARLPAKAADAKQPVKPADARKPANAAHAKAAEAKAANTKPVTADSKSTEAKAANTKPATVADSKPAEALKEVLPPGQLKKGGTGKVAPSAGGGGAKKSSQEAVTAAEHDKNKDLKQMVKSLEGDLMEHRKFLAIEQKKLELVKFETLKEKMRLQDVEETAQKLREQLAATEKIRNYRKKAIGTLNSKAQTIQASVDGKKTELLQLETRLLQSGKAAFGTKYQPRLVATGLPGQTMAITIANTRMLGTPKNQGSKAAPKPHTGKENQGKAPPGVKHQVSPVVLAKEKSRLQELERQLAAKIKHYKDSQGRPQVPPSTPQPENIKTEEKMVFGFGADVEKEMVDITPRRRRSLLGLSPGMKPQLLPSPAPAAGTARFAEGAGTSHKGEAAAAAATAAAAVSQTNTQVEMPSGAKLDKLRKLVRHSLSNLDPVQPGVDQSTSQLCFIPSPEPQQHLLSSSLTEKLDDVEIVPFQKVHKSLLKNFRSYRFSPYFRTKERLSLTSTTFSHKIDPNKVICRFDLMGKCNDDKCQWQHHDDMTLTRDETLQDLSSYSLSLAGIPPKAAPAQCGQLFKKFVDSFSQQNHKITHDQQCLLLVGKVNEHCQHTAPHTTFLETRKWKPVQPEKESPPPPPHGGATSQDDDRKVSLRKTVVAPKPHLDDDGVLTDQDVRYWMLSNQDLGDMESAVIDNPKNVDLWIKLAYKKLHDNNNDTTECLEGALGVLARGLEANQDSADIWWHYLTLFSRREDSGDLLSLSQQALLYAPSYELFWKNLELSQTFPEKNEVCCRVRAYLCSPRCTEPPELRSHHLVEILLHQVSLHVSTGRYMKAINVLQGSLKRKNNKENGLSRLLSIEDKVVAWLSYLSLVELGQLPPQLYDPADSRSARIVCKDKIYLAWRKKSKISLDKLHAMFREAISTCVLSRQLYEVDIPAVIMLYKNLVHMDITLQKDTLGWMGAFSDKHCRKFLRFHPYAVELYLYLAEQEDDPMSAAEADQMRADQLPGTERGNRQGPAKRLLDECLKANPCSARLYHGFASYYLLQNDADSALQMLEMCAIQHFQADVNNSWSCDPNLLYCKLLSQPVPLSFKAPNLWSEVNQSVIDDQLQYLWLNYSLLLELQGDVDQATEAFETALCKLKSTQDVQLVWERYLHQSYQRVQCTTNTAEKSALFQQFQALVQRCLTTSPCKVALPQTPGRYWMDYSFHNSVLDFYFSCLPTEELGTAYDTFINKMPSNVRLIKKACERAMRADDITLVRGLCMTALCDKKLAADLWKMYISATYREGSFKEVSKLYKKATRHLPLLMTLWKDYALFELAHGTEDSVRQIYQSCLKLDVNIFDYLQAVLHPK